MVYGEEGTFLFTKQNDSNDIFYKKKWRTTRNYNEKPNHLLQGEHSIPGDSPGQSTKQERKNYQNKGQSKENFK